MKKKLLSIIIALFILFTTVPAVFAEADLNVGSIVVKLAEYQKDDREVLMRVFRSFLGRDSGVELLKAEIK